jgi:hypothetical protein
MDHLLFMQLRDGGVFGFLVEEAKEKSARCGKYNCQGNKGSFVMGIQKFDLRFGSTFRA